MQSYPLGGKRPYICSPALSTERARDMKIFRHSVSVCPTPTLARCQSCGSRDFASPELSPKDIVSKHVTESVQNIIVNLRGGGRKRAKGISSVTKKRKNDKRVCVIKRETS